METKTKNTNINGAIEELLNKTKDGDEITLDAFCKMVPGATRQECVQALRNSGSGIFVTGRRGHKSRWVYGPKSKEVSHKFGLRRLRLSNGSSQVSPSTDAVQSLGLELRIGVGDQVTTIPLKIEIGAAAPVAA